MNQSSPGMFIRFIFSKIIKEELILRLIHFMESILIHLLMLDLRKIALLMFAMMRKRKVMLVAMF